MHIFEILIREKLSFWPDLVKPENGVELLFIKNRLLPIESKIKPDKFFLSV